MNEAKEGMKAMLFNLALAVTLASACPFSARCQVQEIQLSPSDSLQEIIEKAAAVRQSPRQVEWQKIEYAAFVHFGMNTFTDKEWGEGDEDPALFNPTKLDARQWMKIFKAAGMREVVLTAKHHDGFCLWPSAYTDHSVKNSPWRGGKGDVVKEASEAAREAGLKFGVYLSPWDRHEPSYGTEAYNDYYKNQLRELLTNYGEIAEVWMDGACGDGDPRCNATPYDWQGYFDIVREQQPNAVISIVGPDVRWVGNEAGNARASEWSALPERYDAMADNLGGREKLLEAAKNGEKLAWKPAQVDVSIRPGWFYHKSHDYMLRPDERLLDIYYGSVGGNAALLLNVPPDKRGLIAKSDAMALKKLKIALDDAFDVNYAEGRSAAAANDSEQPGHEADHAVDGNQDTFWTAKEGAESAELIVDLGRKETFDVAMLQENILLGQRIEAFFIDAWDGSVWNEIAGSGTVGYKRLLRFDETTTDRVRIRIAKSRLNPTLAEVGLYYSKKDENPPAAVNGSSEEYFPSLPAGKKLKLVWERRIQRAEAGRSEMEPSDGPPARRLLARGRCEL